MMRDRKYTHGYMSIIAFLLVINHFLMWKRGVGWGDYLQSFSFGKKEEGGGYIKYFISNFTLYSQLIVFCQYLSVVSAYPTRRHKKRKYVCQNKIYFPHKKENDWSLM